MFIGDRAGGAGSRRQVARKKKLDPSHERGQGEGRDEREKAKRCLEPGKTFVSGSRGGHARAKRTRRLYARRTF